MARMVRRVGVRRRVLTHRRTPFTPDRRHRARNMRRRWAMGVNVHEPIKAIYSSACGHLAIDGGHFACGLGRVPAAAGFGASAGGLSDDPGADVLSGCQPGGDGVIGDGSAGAAVWADTGPEPDDIDE